MDIFTNLATLRPFVAYLLFFVFFMGLTLTVSFVIRRFTNYEMRKRTTIWLAFFWVLSG